MVRLSSRSPKLNYPKIGNKDARWLPGGRSASGPSLNATLTEEKQTEADLTKIAESEVNQHAEAA